MKKVLKVLLGVFAVILVIMVVVPFFIDVDQYRPQVIKAANEQLNGSLELGKLKLSLWGNVDIGIDGLTLKDAHQKTLVSVKDAAFHLSYLSLISGAPLITLTLKQPEINVSKNKEGKLNVMSLMKTASSAQAEDHSNAPNAILNGSATTASAQKMQLPALALNAHFGLYIENAKLTYQDEVMALSNTIDRLNLKIKDFSLTRKTELELWADLKTKMGTDLSLDGPLRFIAELKPEISKGEFKGAALVATFTADDLEIQKGTLFSKAKGVPLHFAFDGSLSQDSLKLNKAAAKFHNAEIIVSGEYAQATGANLHFEAKPIELKSWSELIPLLKAYELEGALGLIGNFKGKPENPVYDAKLTIKNLAMKGPHLKGKPIINGEIQVLTDRIEKLLISLKGPGNEMFLDAKLVSFAKPQITFSFTSPKGLDLDQWIEFPKTEAAHANQENTQSSQKISEKSSSVAVDEDAELEPLRTNAVLKSLGIDGTVAIAFIKAKGTRIDDLGLKFQMKNLLLSFTGFKMKVFDGVINGNFSSDLKPVAPQYTMGLNVNGFDMQKAVESQMPSFKNTIDGKLSATLQGNGSSFNPDMAKRKLQMKGEFKIVNAQFKSMDIAKMASEGLSGALSKVPMLKGKQLNAKSNAGSKYDLISSTFTLQNGVLDAPNFNAKAAPKSGIDLHGSTKMGLIDEFIDAKWELVDTQRVTGADQISVSIGSRTVNNVLAKSEKDPVMLPITVTCKWSAPCTHYDQVAEYLAGVVAKRIGGASTDVVKDTFKKALGNQNLGDGLKKLFGH